MALSLLTSTKHTDAISIDRRAGGSWVDGNYVQGANTNFPSERASIQPTPFKELLKNPEGDHFKDQRTFFSTFQFEDNDKVTITATGEKFLIMKLGDWDRFSLTPDHYEAIGVSLDDQSE